jgi:hypothetical protein
MFQFFEMPCVLIFCILGWKKSTAMKSVKCWLSLRMLLRTHILPSGRLKNDIGGRWSDVSRCRKAMRTRFLHPVYPKKRLGRSCLSDFLVGEWPWEHNLLSGRLKKRNCWSRWSDVSRCRKAMRTHFLHPRYRIKATWTKLLKDALSRRMSQRTHNLPSGRLKNQILKIHEAKFQGVERPYELFFGNLRIEKSYLVEVA